MPATNSTSDVQINLAENALVIYKQQLRAVSCLADKIEIKRKIAAKAKQLTDLKLNYHGILK